jgi:hypothetical protein
MLGFNFVSGLSGLLFRTLSSSMYFGDYYTNIKNNYLPNAARLPCKKPNKNEILGNLIFSIISFLYLNNFDYEFFGLMTYAYVYILYILYLNMFLFASGYKNFMLLYSLIIFGITYLFYNFVNIIIISFFLLLICFIIIFENLINYKHVFQDEIHFLDLNVIFLDMMVSISFVFYSGFLKLSCFLLCNFFTFISTNIGIVAFFYGENKINKNSILVLFIKKILLVNETNKEEKLLELIETNLDNQNNLNTNNINIQNNNNPG